MKKLLNTARQLMAISASLLLLTSCALIGLEEEETTSTTTSVTATPAPTVTVPEATVEATVAAVAGSDPIESNATVSILAPKSSSSSSSRSSVRIHQGSIAAIDTSSFSSSSDYPNDKTSLYTYEESAQALDTVNDILCQIGQSRPDLMLNQGNYKAQVDENKCGTEVNDSKGGSGPSYSTWTVHSSRASGEPMNIKMWVPEDDDGEIQARLQVYQPPNDTYPLGFFNLNFQMVDSSKTVQAEGYMRTLKKGDANVLQFYMPQEVNGTNIEISVNVEIEADDSGRGITSTFSWDDSTQSIVPTTYNIAFNSDYFYKQQDVNDPVCLSRNDFFESAWRYGLYTNDGSRVDINSGFPIKANVNSKDYYGYVGYYGLWMPDEANVSSGSTVQKLDFSNPNSSTNYTVKTYGGKLNKHTKRELTLNDIKNIPITWQDQFTGSFSEKRVYWDGTNLKYDAFRNNDSDWQWVELDAVETLTLTSSNVPYGFWFWSQALGGDGRILLTYSNNGDTVGAVTGSTKVIFHTREPIFPGDTVPSTLTCFQNCPEYNNLATGSEWGSPSVYKNPINIDNVSGTTTGYTYSFSTNESSGMVLKDSDNKSIIFNPSNTNLQWGLFTGELFVDNITNRNAMKCDWDATKVCPWKAREELSSFYTWETGKNEWQKLSVLIDGSGNPVKFDPPMIVKYTHSGETSNSGKSYDGGKFYLEYNGFGDLWGIPYFCTDVNGNRTNCGYNTKHVNEFVIPAGTTVNKEGGGDSSLAIGTEFVVKPLEVEQTMKQVSASTCTAAGLALGGMSKPDSSGFTEPSIGDKPTVTGAPSVVAGVKKN